MAFAGQIERSHALGPTVNQRAVRWRSEDDLQNDSRVGPWRPDVLMLGPVRRSVARFEHCGIPFLVSFFKK